MSKNIWLKIIVIIIIQALLLTQADFALAAMYQSKDTFREAALRFQKIAAKSVSMINGIGCVELSLNALNLPHLDLTAIFNLLQGSDYSMSEIVSAKELRTVNNGFYKVLSCVCIDINSINLTLSLNENIIDVRKIIAISRTEVSTGPPAANAKLRDFLLNRIV
ncbi:MAG: hypothetical protein V1739_06975, partial [Candidatus Omnitrophota bacterium]